MQHSIQAPLFILLNQASGNSDAQTTSALIKRILEEAGRAYHLVLLQPGQDLLAAIRAQVAQAKQEGGIVVVAGGDGTINAVAQEVLHSGCLFGVLPQGTYNYFGRCHGISEDTATALRQLLSAQPHPVQVGTVNGKVFLVNASLGLYPRLLEDRESFKAKLGRSRLVAVLAGIFTLLHRPSRLRLTFSGETNQEGIRTPILFVGNNALQLAQLGLATDTVQASQTAPDLPGQLTAITLNPVSAWRLFLLALRGALGALGEHEDVHPFRFRQLTVVSQPRWRHRRFKVATDGEIQWLRAPLHFEALPEALWLMCPVAEEKAAADAGSAESAMVTP